LAILGPARRHRQTGRDERQVEVEKEGSMKNGVALLSVLGVAGKLFTAERQIAGAGDFHRFFFA